MFLIVFDTTLIKNDTNALFFMVFGLDTNSAIFHVHASDTKKEIATKLFDKNNKNKQIILFTFLSGILGLSFTFCLISNFDVNHQ